MLAKIFPKGLRHGIQVRGEVTYKSDLGADKPICKRGKRLGDIVPNIIEKQNVIKEKKSHHHCFAGRSLR